MVPATFVGLALFIAFITPGYMWVRVEERTRPRPDRSQVLEVAELLAIGAITSLFSAAIVAALGTYLPPLLHVADWARAPDPTMFIRAEAMPALASLVLTVLLANVGAFSGATWWFSRTGRRQRAKLRRWWIRRSVDRQAQSQQRIHPANTPWYDVLGSIEKEDDVAILTVVQEDGVVITGLLRSYDVSARGDDQDLALQRPIKRQRPGGKVTELRDDFVLIPARTVRSVLVTVERSPSV